MKEKRWVNLGPVGRSLGVHGAFFVPESTLDTEALRSLTTIRLDANGADESVVEAARHGDGIKLRIARITSPEAAKTLQGKSVWVPRELLPPAEEGSYYHFDLLGLQVFADGAEVGTLHRIEEVPGGVDRWWVKGPAGEIAVPASKKYLAVIDVEHGRLEVREWTALVALNRGETS